MVHILILILFLFTGIASGWIVFDLLPEKFIEYTRLQRVRAIYADTYSFMRKKLEEAKIGEASKLGQIRIIDNAVINKKHIIN